MGSYDVIIVGGGPAGLQCGRNLAAGGRSVLVLERSDSYTKNSFSSAGVPREALADFHLPQTIVGSTWNQIRLVTTKHSKVWKSETPRGYVLDFTGLRNFLASEVRKPGQEVRMSSRFKSSRQENGKVTVISQETSAQEERIDTTRVLVDATGPQRVVMRSLAPPAQDLLGGVGLEYLIEVPSEKFIKNELVFLIGQKWMPCGYSWIFPMQEGRLKVGAGAMFWKKSPKPLKDYVELLIKDYLKLEQYRILDIHGGHVSYSLSRMDPHHAGPVVAIGDTVSTLNLLGAEGIRHAMNSANTAAQEICDYLDGKIPDFSGYEKKMRKRFDSKWNYCSKAAKVMYRQLNDRQIDLLAARFAGRLSMDDIMDVLFFYRFDKGIFRFLQKIAQVIF